MFKSLSNLKEREEGQGLVEYALILVLVAVVVIVVLSLVGPGVGNIFSEVVTALNAGATGSVADSGEPVIEADCLTDGMSTVYEFPAGVKILQPPVTNYDRSHGCGDGKVVWASGMNNYVLRASEFTTTEGQEYCSSRGKVFAHYSEIYFCH